MSSNNVYALIFKIKAIQILNSYNVAIEMFLINFDYIIFKFLSIYFTNDKWQMYGITNKNIFYAYILFLYYTFVFVLYSFVNNTHCSYIYI